MPAPNPDALDFLLTRRSRLARTLTGPGPDRATIERILTAAARSPDHGKLEPWRFIVLEEAACRRLGALTRSLGAAQGRDVDKLAKDALGFDAAPVCVAVVASPKASEKIPEVEQTLSAGAVCLALLNAALAAGWGANWLSSWMALDRAFLSDGLSLAEHEWIAGYIHLGTETQPVHERPRPDVAALTAWVEA
ncbi:MAG: nitroreductase family protein [Pseudomonadota bacterium]